MGYNPKLMLILKTDCTWLQNFFDSVFKKANHNDAAKLYVKQCGHGQQDKQQEQFGNA